jgi:NAD(P)-dependent dehydrogenase (short-subunit alcohol dehydrogenase family)
MSARDQRASVATVPASDPAKLLRPGLLRGVSLLLAGAAADRHRPSPTGAAVGAAFTELGARVCACEVIAARQVAQEQEIDRAVSEALGNGARIEMLVVDGGGMFAAAGGGRSGLRVCVEAAWSATRAVAGAAFIPGGQGGRIADLAPAPGAGAHASAARAGLETLARTLSIEWARYGVTTVAIGAGDDTSPAELGALSAYLASQAGAYFSGCLLDLAGP